MAQQLTVELDDDAMCKVQAAARARGWDPNRITGAQLVQLLGEDSAPAPAKVSHEALSAAERAKRLAAVMAMHGIWKNDTTKPKDGAAYQRKVRTEWR